MKQIDVHSHVLPEMDDGSDCIQTSCQMLKSLINQGVTTVCATPHYDAGKETADRFVERRNQSVDILLQDVRFPNCSIIPGAEVSYFRGISAEKQLDKLCYVGTHTLLLEMPFAEWNVYQIEEVISLVLDRNYQVILAHPERFLFSKQNEQYLNKIMQLPVFFQINADTLTRLTARKNAFKLFKITEYLLLGSDCHDMGKRAPKIKKARQIIQSKMGSEYLAHIDTCAENALADALEVKGYAYKAQ